jgi:hypothetical protein
VADGIHASWRLCIDVVAHMEPWARALGAAWARGHLRLCLHVTRASGGLCGGLCASATCNNLRVYLQRLRKSIDDCYALS